MVVKRTDLNVYHVKIANVGSPIIAQDYHVLAKESDRAEQLAKTWFRDEYKQSGRVVSVDRNATEVIVATGDLEAIV